MLLLLEKMGCGRSKNQSPKNGGHDIPDAKEKGTGRKKKNKGDKKENKDPKKSTDKVPNENNRLNSPNRSNFNQCNSLKPPPQSINGSSQQTLTIDVECPLNQEKVPTSKSKDVKEFSGKQTNIKITSSQLEFFRMLDEKIEQGRDYTSEEALDISTP